MRQNDACVRHCRGGIFATAILMLCLPGYGEGNVRLHGILVAEPCVIPPGEEEVFMDFGNVVDKYLYLNQRTPGQTFEIHLAECDLHLGNMVKVTFKGTESLKLPGLLALASGSQASGIAIGMESIAGRALPINSPGENMALAAGDTRIRVQAYVQGEPEALANKSIARGPFSAVATFSLEYE